MMKIFIFICLNFITLSYSLSFKNRLIYPTHDAFKYYIGPYLTSKSIAKVYNDFHKIDSKFTLEKCFPIILLEVYKLFIFEKPHDNSQILYHIPFGNQNVIFCTKTKIARALKHDQKGHTFSTEEDLLILVGEHIVEKNIKYEMSENKKALIFYFENKFALFSKIESELIFICLVNNCTFSIDDSFLTLKSRIFVKAAEYQFPTDLDYFFKAKFSKQKCKFFLQIFSWNQILIEKYNTFYFETLNKASEIVQPLPDRIAATLFVIFFIPIGTLCLNILFIPYMIQSLAFTLPFWFFAGRCMFMKIFAISPIMPLLAGVQNYYDSTSLGIYPKNIGVLASHFKLKSGFLREENCDNMSFWLPFFTIFINIIIMIFLEAFGAYDFCIRTHK